MSQQHYLKVMSSLGYVKLPIENKHRNLIEFGNRSYGPHLMQRCIKNDLVDSKYSLLRYFLKCFRGFKISVSYFYLIFFPL